MTHLGGGGKDLCDVVDAVEVWDQLQPQVDLGTRAWHTDLEWAERTLDGLWSELRARAVQPTTFLRRKGRRFQGWDKVKQLFN